MASNLWVLEILTGKKPEQTSIYGQLHSNDIIYNLYVKINRVRFMSKYGPGKIIQSLSKRLFFVEQIQKAVYHVYFKTHQPVNITYLTSPRLQYMIKCSDDTSDIFVYIPFTNDEDWKT